MRKRLSLPLFFIVLGERTHAWGLKPLQPTRVSPRESAIVKQQNAYTPPAKRANSPSFLTLRGGSIPPIVLRTLVPMAGVFVCNIMTASGLPAIFNARKEESLGNLNPLPFIMLLGNCLAWVAYSLKIGNPYIFLSNALGVLSGLFMYSSGVKIGSPDQKQLLEISALAVAFVLLAVNGVGSLLLDNEAQIKMAALLANAFTLAFYCSPLSAMGKIIRTKDATSLCPPMVAMAGVNGLLWTCYGIAISNFSVALPNAIGVFLSALQLSLVFCYRKPPSKPGLNLPDLSAVIA
mmetsp:Transcript_13914/g.28500  ORF Transcript_13914/g.28500 Transcript_13914/m.28500 type:complete len:292 (+) Transcript_13914:154-1029(+)